MFATNICIFHNYLHVKSVRNEFCRHNWCHGPCRWPVNLSLTHQSSAASAKRPKQRASDEVAAHTPLPLSPLMKRQPGYVSCSPLGGHRISSQCVVHTVLHSYTVSGSHIVLMDTHDIPVNLPPDPYRLLTCSSNMQDKEKGAFFSFCLQLLKSV